MAIALSAVNRSQIKPPAIIIALQRGFPALPAFHLFISRLIPLQKPNTWCAVQKGVCVCVSELRFSINILYLMMFFSICISGLHFNWLYMNCSLIWHNIGHCVWLTSWQVRPWNTLTNNKWQNSSRCWTLCMHGFLHLLSAWSTVLCWPRLKKKRSLCPGLIQSHAVMIFTNKLEHQPTLQSFVICCHQWWETKGLLQLNWFETHN